jgi:hypothetical protein
MSEATAQAEVTAPEAENQEPETMFDGVEAAQPEATNEQENVVDTPENPEARPDWLPEKFKTPEDLVKAYNEMGAKIREKVEPPEAYELTDLEGNALELTEQDIETYKKAGLTNDQAQELVKYFYEAVIPDVIEAKVAVEKDRLAMEWGVKSDSNEFTQQLASVKAWANQNLPESLVTELSRTASGVASIAKLMEQGAKVHMATAQPNTRPDKAQLQELMNDERYWKGDEQYRKYVHDQFKAAYD